MEIIKLDKSELAEVVADEIATKISDWQGKNVSDNFRLGLSGGRTPQEIYQLIAEDTRIDWQRVTCIIVDERFVPSSDEQSNLGMIREHLFVPADVPEVNIVCFKTDGSIGYYTSADEMTEKIESLLDERDLLFDLLILGVGEDGHVASIFPYSNAADEEEIIGMVAEAPAKFSVAKRLTLSIGALGNCLDLIVVLSGSKKEEIFEEIQEEDGDLPIHDILSRIEDSIVYFGE